MLRIFHKFVEIIKRLRNGFDQRVALPLVLVTLFCYSFVLIHPFKAAAGPVAASSSSWESNKNVSNQSTMQVDNTQNLPTMTPMALPKPVTPVPSISTKPQPQPKKEGSDKWRLHENGGESVQDSQDSNWLSSDDSINNEMSQSQHLQNDNNN